MRTLVVSLAAVVLVSLGRSASAQISQRAAQGARIEGQAPAEPRVSNARGPDYDVEFDPDTLADTLEDGSIPRIVCRPVKGFARLTRPRTHFVPELLKSIEVM